MSEHKIREAAQERASADARAKAGPLTCSSCEYWRELPDAQAVGAIIAANGLRERVGNCLLNPSLSNHVPIPSQVDPRRGQLAQTPYYPITADTATCMWHPQRVELLLKGAIAFAVQHWREYLDYRPGKHPDTIAAGFSRTPSFLEALRFAVGWREPQNVPLTEAQLNPSPPESIRGELARNEAELRALDGKAP